MATILCTVFVTLVVGIFAGYFFCHWHTYAIRQKNTELEEGKKSLTTRIERIEHTNSVLQADLDKTKKKLDEKEKQNELLSTRNRDLRREKENLARSLRELREYKEKVSALPKTQETHVDDQRTRLYKEIDTEKIERTVPTPVYGKIKE